jgi:hypothetical protein
MQPEHPGGLLPGRNTPRVRFERPRNPNNCHRVGTEEHANRSITSSGAARSGTARNGAARGRL